MLILFGSNAAQPNRVGATRQGIAYEFNFNAIRKHA